MLIMCFAFHEFLFFYQGTGNVQAIDIKGAKGTRIYHEDKEACWNPMAFLRMHNLKFLRVRSISVQLDISRLPNNLSYLECNDYPLKSLHSLPAGLLVLRLPCSKIEVLWEGMKVRLLISIFIQICF